jgi:hypothetical protein
MSDIDQQIAGLAKMQAATQEQLKMLLARNTEKEFRYQEGFVNSPPNQSVFPVVSVTTLIPNFTLALTPSNNGVASSSIDVHGVTIEMMGRRSTLSPTTALLVCEFDKEASFPNPKRLYIFPEQETVPSSFTANTGVVNARYMKHFPIRYRYVRFYFSTVNSPLINSTTTIDNVFTSLGGAIIVTFYGN